MFAKYAVAGAFLVALSALRLKNPRDRIRDAWIALGILAGACYSLPAATLLTGRETTSFDAVFYCIDSDIGLCGRGLCLLVNTHHWLWVVLEVAYQGLPLWIALVYIIERDLNMLKAMAVGFLLLPVSYYLFPAIGPIHAFPGWPYRAPHVAFKVLDIHAAGLPRNCFPSGHFVLAFMPLLYIRSWKLRAPALVYLLLMIMATVGSGEHYPIDLLAAVPYSLAIWAIIYPAIDVCACQATAASGNQRL